MNGKRWIVMHDSASKNRDYCSLQKNSWTFKQSTKLSTKSVELSPSGFFPSSVVQSAEQFGECLRMFEDDIHFFMVENSIRDKYGEEVLENLTT